MENSTYVETNEAMKFRFNYRRPPLPPIACAKFDGRSASTILYCGDFLDEYQRDKLGEHVQNHCIEHDHSVVRRNGGSTILYVCQPYDPHNLFDYSDVGKSVWKRLAIPGTNANESSYSRLFGLSATDLACESERHIGDPVSKTSSLGEDVEVIDAAENDEYKDRLEVVTQLEPHSLSFDHWLLDIVGLIEEITGTKPTEDGELESHGNDEKQRVQTDVKRKVILVGYGMGGWLALLAARKLPQLVEGVIGVSTCFDFIERDFETALDDRQRTQVLAGDAVWTEFGLTTKRLLEESRQHRLGDCESLTIDCPTRFVHCLKDTRAPYSELVRLTECFANTEQDVEIETLGKGEPRDMSGPKGKLAVIEVIDQVIKLNDVKRQKAAEEEAELARIVEKKLKIQQERELKNREDRAKTLQKNKEEQAKALAKAKERDTREARESENRLKHHDTPGEAIRNERLALIKLKQDYYQMKIDSLNEHT